MRIDISFQHLSTSDEIKKYAEEKSLTLKRYFDGKIHVVWHLSADHGEVTAKCQLKGSHMDYHGEETAGDLKEAIDLTIDKVERQVRKHKEIIKDHKHHKG